jgi:hypothetical protein
MHVLQALITDPVIHEFIRHGYISALSNWDDIASTVRRTGQDGGRRPVPAVWGNQWGLPGIFPISALMSQTGDVVWIEGPPGDSNATAWNTLTYKVGDASGGFKKPVFTIEYGKGRGMQKQLSEAHANGGLMLTMYGLSWQSKNESLIAGRHARFVGGAAHRHLFIDRARRAKVGLLWSAPTLMWRRFSSLNVGSHYGPSGIQFFGYFAGAARIMEDEHVPYVKMLCVYVCVCV